MRKLSILTAAASVLAVFAGVAHADGSSMSRWTGDSYQAFEAARTDSHVAARQVQSGSNPDNGTSRWNGDSYRMFEAVRTSPTTITVTEVRVTRVTPVSSVPSRSTTRGRESVNPFRDDTGA
jgi:hypothetical protein